MTKIIHIVISLIELSLGLGGDAGNWGHRSILFARPWLGGAQCPTQECVLPVSYFTMQLYMSYLKFHDQYVWLMLQWNSLHNSDARHEREKNTMALHPMDCFLQPVTELWTDVYSIILLECGRLISLINNLLIGQYACTNVFHHDSRLEGLVNNLCMIHKTTPMCYITMCLLTICSSQMCYTVLQRRRLKCLNNHLTICSWDIE